MKSDGALRPKRIAMSHRHHVSGKYLFITIVLNLIITIAQIVGGLVSGSLALLSDAMHNFSDVLALVIAYVANRLAARPSTKEYTFGLKRAEILAALFNALVLVGIGIFLIVEAFHKFFQPEPIASSWVIWLGMLSIILNTASVLLIKEDSHENMNIKAAYLHLLTDVMTSVAVVVGGILMAAWDIYWVDPLISILIALYLIKAAFSLIKESSSVLMQSAPKNIDIEKVAKMIESEPEIDNVHHIHLWQLDDKHIFLEAHIDFKKDLNLSQCNKILEKLEDKLEALHISHTTFQCEYKRKDSKSKIGKEI